MNEINTFAILLAFTIIMPIGVIGAYYGIGYSLLERFVNPSFDLKLERLSMLFLVYFIFALIVTLQFTLVSEHFRLPEELLKSPFQILVPAVIYLVIRGIVRFHSSRVGREHINMLVFLVLVHTSVIAIYSLIKDPYILVQIRFPLETIGAQLIAALFIPLAGETILHLMVDQYKYVRKYFVKDKKLIDLSEELPIKLNFISGESQIQRIIKKMINNKGDLSIITKGYKTVSDYQIPISKRAESGIVRIIGSDPKQMAKENYSEETIKEIKELISNLNNHGIPTCQGIFDDIKLIIDNNHQVLMTFSKFENSKVGIYSAHPLVVSLFVDYFRTKCMYLRCNEKCINKKTRSKKK